MRFCKSGMIGVHSKGTDIGLKLFEKYRTDHVLYSRNNLPARRTGVCAQGKGLPVWQTLICCTNHEKTSMGV